MTYDEGLADRIRSAVEAAAGSAGYREIKMFGGLCWTVNTHMAVGIGAAGFVDASGASVRFSPHLSWRDEPLQAAVSSRLGLPVVVENDANAAAWAEWRFGAASGAELRCGVSARTRSSSCPSQVTTPATTFVPPMSTPTVSSGGSPTTAATEDALRVGTRRRGGGSAPGRGVTSAPFPARPEPSGWVTG